MDILLYCLLKGVFLFVGTKEFCLSEEQQMIDESTDCSGYDPSSEEDEEGEMLDDSEDQGDNNSEEQQPVIGKQDKVGGDKAKKKRRLLKVNSLSIYT